MTFEAKGSLITHTFNALKKKEVGVKHSFLPHIYSSSAVLKL